MLMVSPLGVLLLLRERQCKVCPSRGWARPPSCTVRSEMLGPLCCCSGPASGRGCILAMGTAAAGCQCKEGLGIQEKQVSS